MVEDTSTSSARPAAAAEAGSRALLVPAVAWLIPGAGHLMQKRWIRGFLLMGSIVAMFVLGLAMDGKIYSPNAGDLLDILGFFGDLGAGCLYLAGRGLSWGSAAITSAAADYGTKFIVVAGLLNIMSAVDA